MLIDSLRWWLTMNCAGEINATVLFAIAILQYGHRDGGAQWKRPIITFPGVIGWTNTVVLLVLAVSSVGRARFRY